MTSPSGAERRLALGAGLLMIGRDPSCSIPLDSPFVAWQHACIDMGLDGPVVAELGGPNGVFLNGVRLRGPAPIGAGDVIVIGDTTIECRAEPVAHDLLHVDARLYEVRIGHRLLERRLSVQEFRLVRYLYERTDRVCARHQLGDAVWGPHNWDLNMLHQLVHRLRDKLESDPRRPRYLHCVPRIGYRLTP